MNIIFKKTHIGPKQHICCRLGLFWLSLPPTGLPVVHSVEYSLCIFIKAIISMKNMKKKKKKKTYLRPKQCQTGCLGTFCHIWLPQTIVVRRWMCGW